MARCGFSFGQTILFLLEREICLLLLEPAYRRALQGKLSMNSPKMTPAQIAALIKINPDFAGMFRRPQVEAPKAGEAQAVEKRAEQSLSSVGDTSGAKMAEPLQSRWPTTRQAAILSLLIGVVGLLNTEVAGDPDVGLVFRIFNSTISYIGLSYTGFLTCVIAFFAACWWRENWPKRLH
jgi:hypothetical protein